MPETAARDPAVRAVLRQPFAEQIAFFRGKLGNLVPTEVWTDMMGAAHDRGFMVAGAQNADLLAGLAAAVDKVIAGGGSIGDFRKDFAALVERFGWSYRGEFNWRTRTIYRANLSTSYAAGRLAQLRKFPFWIYKHGDSLEPRPQHLDWDGLVLPADHEFWQTHYPPSDWGCTCRVVGIMRLEDAAALGGNVDKKLPENWRDIDPKTGVMIGVGKGWDYQPGATVVDTVKMLAEKTQQWEYTLAKSYMQSVPERSRDALAVAYRDLPSVANDARLYAQRALEAGAEVAPYRTLGLVTNQQAALVRAGLGVDVRGFDFAIDPFAPKHIAKEHGDERTEALRGQRAITPADYMRLLPLLNAADRVWVEGGEVLFEKVFGDERQVAVFAPLAKRMMLALKSMRIYRKAPSRSTSETGGV